MSIKTEIDRISSNITAAYEAATEKGADIPTQRNSTNLAATIRSIPTATFPIGMITMWYGTATTVPDGWAICDGTNGTPDLRDKFVVGAGSTYSLKATGGAATVALTSANMPSHTHVQRLPAGAGATAAANMMSGSSGSALPVAGTWFTSSGITYATNSAIGAAAIPTAATGSGTAHDNLPPYYALYYIMRIS